MTYRTRTILRRALPIAFWLLAVGGTIALPFLLSTLNSKLSTLNYWCGFAVTGFVLCCLVIIQRIDRHVSSAEETFQVAVLLGIASYWMPTVLFLLVPFAIYAIYRKAFRWRSLLAMVLGLGLVAIHVAVLLWFGWIDCPWASFFATDYVWGWIPLGAVLLAWLASTIVQQTLRER